MQTTTLTPTWRSDLVTQPAIASGRRQVSLDEEENLNNCAVRRMDKDMENNASPGMEEQFVGTQILDGHGCGCPRDSSMLGDGLVCLCTCRAGVQRGGVHVRSGLGLGADTAVAYFASQGVLLVGRLVGRSNEVPASGQG